jgi:hypothetical protein
MAWGNDGRTFEVSKLMCTIFFAPTLCYSVMFYRIFVYCKMKKLTVVGIVAGNKTMERLLYISVTYKSEAEIILSDFSHVYIYINVY